jgi:hypothetical protein
MPTTVAITLPFPAAPGLADELSEDLGVYPQIEGHARGVDPTAPGIVVATALGLFVSGMIQQFGAAAADRLMSAFGRLGPMAHRTNHRNIRLVDEGRSIVIILSPEAIDDERAMTALIAQERDLFQPETELHWNADSGRWQAM